jgi:3-hydroxybutyryl-CoA dehydrogenase
MEIKKVVVVGTGTMGGQIGFQCAVSGFQTVMCDINEASLDGCRSSHRRFAEVFVAKRGSSQEVVDAAVARLSYTDDLAQACRDADLVSESVPEDPEIKREVYAQLNRCCPDHTIFTTNTSTLLPSQFAESTGRPDRFLALHFANPVWDANIGEVMPHPGTDPEVFERVLEFVAEIGMVPIRLEKEQNGYIINSLLMPLLIAAQGLITNDVATHEDVDRTWMISTKMPVGPFGIMDLIGLETIYNVVRYWAETDGDEELRKNAVFIKERFVDRGRLGVKSGEGYYSYPGPAFAQEGFLG